MDGRSDAPFCSEKESTASTNATQSRSCPAGQYGSATVWSSFPQHGATYPTMGTAEIRTSTTCPMARSLPHHALGSGRH
eukprot:574979-Pyramimonas_sp.AAC.1